MMKLILAFKYIFSLLIFLCISCTEIERDNLLDPKNPSSERDAVVLLEAFVNSNDPHGYNQYAMQAIKDLTEEFGDKLIVLEYHKNVSDTTLNDTYYIGNEVDLLYSEYTIDVTSKPIRTVGLPDLFINGSTERVQGASSVDNVFNRVQKIANEQLLEKGNYSLEAEATLSSGTVSGEYRVARLGNKASQKVLIRIVTTFDNGSIKNIVSSLDRTHSITEIKSGEYVENDFSIDLPGKAAEHIIFVLLDETGETVLAAIEEEL